MRIAGIAGGLTVSELTYTYGPKTALDNVSFDVAPGQFCALLGPNGAGKSTLIKRYVLPSLNSNPL